jgi:hypothetical protein
LEIDRSRTHTNEARTGLGALSLKAVACGAVRGEELRSLVNDLGAREINVGTRRCGGRHCVSGTGGDESNGNEKNNGEGGAAAAFAVGFGFL